MTRTHPSFSGYRLRPAIISHADWLCFRFPLSLRMVEEMLAARGILVQSRRNAAAAKRLMRKLLKKQGWAPRGMIADKLGSCGALKRQIMPGVEHRQHKGLNNRALQPTRRRERIMKRFKSPRQAQRFLAVHDQVAKFFRRPANISNADHCRHRAQAFQTWADVTGIALAA